MVQLRLVPCWTRGPLVLPPGVSSCCALQGIEQNWTQGSVYSLLLQTPPLNEAKLPSNLCYFYLMLLEKPHLTFLREENMGKLGAHETM